MPSSIVSIIQEHFCDGITPNYIIPNYTSAFISFFNCFYQRDQNFYSISATESSPLSGIKTCQIVQKTQETAHIFAADSLALTESARSFNRLVH